VEREGEIKSKVRHMGRVAEKKSPYAFRVCVCLRERDARFRIAGPGPEVAESHATVRTATAIMPARTSVPTIETPAFSEEGGAAPEDFPLKLHTTVWLVFPLTARRQVWSCFVESEFEDWHCVAPAVMLMTEGRDAQQSPALEVEPKTEQP